MDQKTASEKVFPGTLDALRPVWAKVDEAMTQRGLARDVKTIYVSYTNSRGIVAAVHPDPATMTIEVALALPADTDDPSLYDAIHLKWRTLPVALRLSPDEPVGEAFVRLLDAAVAQAGSVAPRPNDDFMKQPRRGRRDWDD